MRSTLIRSIPVALALLAVGSSALPAQIELAHGQKLPPLRPLGPIQARSSEPLGSVSTAVPLPGGKVLVNDILRRRVVLFDSTLTNVTVVADSTSATANAYGARGGGLLQWGGDSALFVDPASLSMMVVTPSGELGRVMAVPRPNEIGLMVGGPNGRPGFDAKGRMVQRGQARGRPGRANARPVFGNFVIPELPDSAPVVRVDLGTRALDTIGQVKVQRADIKVTEGANGQPNIQVRQNPLQMVDDWALLSDGSVAFVRGHDFHIDRVGADGTLSSSAKLPFEWQRLDEEAKIVLLDSARSAIERQREEARRLVGEAGGPAAFVQGGGAERMIAGGAAGGGGGGGGGRDGARAAGGTAPGSSANGNPQQRGGGQGAGPGGPGGFQIPAVNLVNANELPDYRPPFTAGSSLGDLEGNLWVRTTLPVGEQGPIYYVIDSKNEVADRIQVPQGRTIAGFGKGGVVYLAMRDTEGNNRLEWARWK